MKDQLQLQEIAGYFANGLRIKILNYECDYVGIEYAEVNGYYFIGDSLHLTYVGGSTGKDCNSCKPILTPMSDIIFPQHILGLGYRTMSRDLKEPTWTLSQIQYIYKNHFDIHNLIGRGLAISIHDIPTKP